jgi:hypothetical protein
VTTENIVGLVIGLVGGLAANLLVGYVFYQRSGRELRQEAVHLRAETSRVRTMVNTIARALQESKLVDLTWDEHDEMRGVHFTRTFGGSIDPSGTLKTELIRGTDVTAQGSSR